jgi:hypothetical protein
MQSGRQASNRASAPCPERDLIRDLGPETGPVRPAWVTRSQEAETSKAALPTRFAALRTLRPRSPITTRGPAKAFFIQSPGLQLASPVSVLESSGPGTSACLSRGVDRGRFDPSHAPTAERASPDSGPSRPLSRQAGGVHRPRAGWRMHCATSGRPRSSGLLQGRGHPKDRLCDFSQSLHRSSSALCQRRTAIVPVLWCIQLPPTLTITRYK